MSPTNTAATGVLVLRLTLGVMFLAHSVVLKYFTFTLAGTAKFFASIGYPAEFAYLVFAGELAIGLALIAGFQVRLAALAGIPILIGAMLVHVPNGWVFSAQGGGWEYPAFLIVVSVVQALLGAGGFALSKRDWLPGPLAVFAR